MVKHYFCAVMVLSSYLSVNTFLFVEHTLFLRFGNMTFAKISIVRTVTFPHNSQFRVYVVVCDVVM